jgi:hypothetical protein
MAKIFFRIALNMTAASRALSADAIEAFRMELDPQWRGAGDLRSA